MALRPPGRNLTDQDYDEIEADFHAGGRLTTAYGFMLFAACGIAALGLLQSSVAVVIGAMLISPLMGPILSMGMALARVEPRLFKTAALTLAVGASLSVLASTLIVWASPLKDVTPEILARTRPTLLDLIVALLSGFVGAYLSINRKGGSIAGVAIATALMPPLAVVGYGVATTSWMIAGGALLLFLTNVVAILGAVFGVARRYGFGPVERRDAAWETFALLGATVLLCVPLALSLRTIVVEARETTRVRGVIEKAFAGAGPHITDLSVQTKGGGATGVQCVVVTRKFLPDAAARIARELNPGAVISIEQVVTASGAPTAAPRGSALGRSPTDIAVAARAPQDRLRAMLAPAGQIVSIGQQGRVIRVNLALPAAAHLADYHAVEQAAQRFVPEAQVEVVPPLVELPVIRFARGTSRLDPAAEAEVDAIGWALVRWSAPSVEVVGAASPNPRGRRAADVRMAERRAEAVAERLRLRGVANVAVGALVPERLADEPEERFLVARVRLAPDPAPAAAGR